MSDGEIGSRFLRPPFIESGGAQMCSLRRNTPREMEQEQFPMTRTIEAANISELIAALLVDSDPLDASACITGVDRENINVPLPSTVFLPATTKVSLNY